eukprot:CAMPEP_0185017494 /NCGR_PEP_ID=MMETSP1103-20130426/437_1 /TAXON_ID=36769 /ORGANISM="Paraphysomonas bandaiensis, Strain Caron Lab Isolate" /LENGTH=241 /DNA_ID=CAMNT_0027546927 /DNA_START=39 /DNA_END=765 /DNA_ORIENTATION=-
MSNEDPFITIERADNITVDQKSQFAESCCKCLGVCCADFENSYDVYVPDGAGATRLRATEDSTCVRRALCNPYHALKLHISSDSDGKKSGNILEIEKPFRCCCPALLAPCQKSITVSRVQPKREVIGYVQEPCLGGVLRPKLKMYREKHGRPLGTVSGPCCCIGGCCKSEFEVTSPEGHPLATIKRGGVSDMGIRRALLSNSDKFQIQYTDNSIPVDDKLVMLSSLLFIDYLFFEGETTAL